LLPCYSKYSTLINNNSGLLLLFRGKGYYDNYLTKAKSLNLQPSTILALAFNQQILEDIPTTENDFLIDRVLSAGDD